MIYLITGPAGAGKSTLMRRLMSHFPTKTVHPGGVGSLPLAYTCQGEEGEIEVLGSYEEIGRSRFGMAEFNRYAHDLENALKHALSMERFRPVFCEGGFQRVTRLDWPTGRAFAAKLTVVLLHPPEDVCQLSVIKRRGDSGINLEAWYRHHRSVMAVAQKFETLGSQIEKFADREAAFNFVATAAGIVNTQPGLPEQTWR